MDLANLERGLVVGTGDLSELALGFCTFGGDHMAMYNVNAGVPKTLVRRLVAWVAEHQSTPAERAVLEAVLETPVSPELVPPGADGATAQRTEEIVGPYELHDFFLYAFVRLGAGPKKILFLAEHAFGDRYDEATLSDLAARLRRAVLRQPVQAVGDARRPQGGLREPVSPRGDWRMPSDASKAAWLREL